MAEIFISYCTDDNAPLPWEQLGWIDVFHQTLTNRLNVYCGRHERPNVWYDKRKIDGNQLLSKTIDAALQETSLLVAVVSPSYVSSSWCRKELTSFAKIAAGSIPEGRSRIFKVVKGPASAGSFLDAIPELADCRGYDFFKSVAGGPPVELNPLRDPADSVEFVDMIDRLANSLRETLKIMPRNPGSGLTVFLADGSSDIASEVEDLRKGLESYGHTVVRAPAGKGDESAYRESLREILPRCRLSIHPIGKYYGAVPEGYDLSLIAIQDAVAAAEAARRPEFSQLSWMSTSVEPRDERQRAFVAMLESRGPQFHRISLEDFKTRVHDVLFPPPPTPARPPSALHPDRQTVYVVCDQRDVEANVRSVEDLLKPHYVVVRSLLERQVRDLSTRHGADLERVVREDHQDNLISCDAVIVYHGEGDQLWLRRKLNEVRNARGFGRQRAFNARAVLLAAPPTPDKETYDNDETLVLPFTEQGAAALEPFHQAMRRSRERVG